MYFKDRPRNLGGVSESGEGSWTVDNGNSLVIIVEREVCKHVENGVSDMTQF